MKKNEKPIGLLGLQGAFLDHIPHLNRLHIPYRIVKSADDLENIGGLIIPGGESTVMSKFLALFNMADVLKRNIARGMPVWGICAGAILLAQIVDDGPGVLEVLPVAARRNAYGRQLDSVEKEISVPVLNRHDFNAVFIRAPRLSLLCDDVDVLADTEGDPVFVKRGSIMATTFHPELTDDSIFHEYFYKTS